MSACQTRGRELKKKKSRNRVRGRQRHPNEDTDTYTQIPKKRIQKKKERGDRESPFSLCSLEK